MKLSEKLTVEEVKFSSLPTFNECDHYIVQPEDGVMQTVIIPVGNDKYLTVNINPHADNVDVKMHGDHDFKDFGTVKAFYNMNGTYDTED